MMRLKAQTAWTRAEGETERIRFARRMALKDPALRLYAILDAECCGRQKVSLVDVASAWRSAGVQLVQYRDKTAAPATVLSNARTLRRLFPSGEAFLILNDYPDLVEASGFDGVHVGQSDCSVDETRRTIGPNRILGVSTHSADEARIAGSTEADYVAVGPVFATRSKVDAEPVVGLCGLQAARASTGKPLVAIGGIGLEDVRSVRQAGADSVALISALLPSEDLAFVTVRAQDFIARLK